MPEANCACTLKTCGKERIRREICMDILARKKLLARNEGISSTRLSEMINKEINGSLKWINNSIKDAMQTLVKSSMIPKMQEEKKPVLPCSKEPKRISDTCRSRALEERCKKSPNVCTSRQTTCHISRQRDKLSTHDSSYLCKKMHENAIPLPIQNKVKRKSKKHSKAANNVNTDSRRMTGNVNICICSETNDNNQVKKKSRPQSYTDTSSNTITESNSRSASASIASSCKLINSIKEKRKKLLMKQLPNFIHEKNSDDNVVRDNGILQHKLSRKELSESDSKEEAGVKVNDENVRCKNIISSTKDVYYCKDTDSTDLRKDLSYLTVPCSSFNARDNTRHSESWITMYPSKPRARLDDNDVFLSRAVCTNVEQQNYRNNVHGNDSECTMCYAVDGNRWLPKSIYTECAVYGEEPKECFADGCKYRNKIFQDSVINRNDIRKRQIGYKLLQQPLGSWQREQLARQWSTCSCITEENEDYCKGVDKDKQELSKNVCSVAECLEKISVCRTPRKLAESATVCETSEFGARKCFEKTRTCKDLEEHSKDTSVCETKFGNSVESSKVTRVCKEFVTEEHAKDTTLCKTISGEPNGLPEEVIVYKTAYSDSKGIPKKTICKKIPDSNFANQDDVNGVFLDDTKDKLIEEGTSSSNLNSPEGNTGNKRIVKLNNKHDNVALNNFTGQQFVNAEQDEQINKMVNSQTKNVHRIPIESIKDSKSLSKSVYSTLPRAQFYNRLNLSSNSSVKETSKTYINQQRIQSLNRSMRNHFQQSNDLTRNLASNKNNNQLKEKTLENLQEEKERQDISEEMKMTEDKQRESLLHRPFKKLIDVIRRGKTFLTDRIETGKIEAKETIADGKKDVEKSGIASNIEDKTNDTKDQQEIVKKMTVPMKSPQTEIADKEIIRKIFARPKSIEALVTDFTIPEKGKKMDIRRTDQTMPKLLRVITAKRSHVLPIVVTTDSKPQQPEVLFIPAEKITTAHVDQEALPKEKITLQEHSPVEVTEEIKADDVIMSEMNVAAIETSVEDAPKDVADENRVSQDIPDKTIKTHVACPQKKPEEKLQKLILCKCDLPSDLNDCLYSIAKCMKDRVPCPHKKSEEKPQKSALCTRELIPSNSNNYSYSIVKCTKCNSIIENCPCKDNRFEQKKIYCARCRLSIMQCICTSKLKNCFKTGKPKFHDTSPLKSSSQICTNCCIRKRKERKCRKTMICCHSHEECRCRCRCATRGDFSRIIDKSKCGSQASCINCGRPRNQCCCATFTLVKCDKIKEVRNRKKTMICLYCDNPRDKCTCRVSIKKCLYCGLPSDVCNCQRNEGHACDYKRIAKKPDENRTICVTSWKSKKEIRRYFEERNFEDTGPNFTEKCRCYKKPKRQRPEKLSYQRLNVFSEVMNELQQKMSESVCCARCWRNPCCCGLPVDQDKRKKERKAENRVEYIKESFI